MPAPTQADDVPKQAPEQNDVDAVPEHEQKDGEAAAAEASKKQDMDPATAVGKASKKQQVGPATEDGNASKKRDAEPAAADDKASKTQDVVTPTKKAKTAAKAAANAAANPDQQARMKKAAEAAMDAAKAAGDGATAQGGGDKPNEQAGDNHTDATPVPMPETPPVQVDQANVRQLRDAFKARKFATLMAQGELHPVHKATYNELAKKNGGPRFSLRPSLSD